MHHKLKWLAALLGMFAVAQASLPQLKDALDPLHYAIITFVVGLVVTILGRLRDVTGGFLWSNKTTLTGLLLIALSAVQGVMGQAEMFLSPTAFMLINFAVSLALGFLGVVNSWSEEKPPAG